MFPSLVIRLKENPGVDAKAVEDRLDDLSIGDKK